MSKILYTCFVLSALSFCCVSCEEVFPSIDLQGSKTLKLYDYYVDEYGNDGIVAYVGTTSDAADSFKIVLSLDETIESWGPQEYIVYKDSVLEPMIKVISFGVAMHQLMYQIGIDNFPAQAWCNQKNKDNCPWAGSWRLPTLTEHNMIVKNIDRLNSYLRNYQGIPMDTTKMYWTCIEDYDQLLEIKGEINNTYDPMNKAIALTPTYKVIGGKSKWLKSNKHNVRAIKYIYYQKQE